MKAREPSVAYVVSHPEAPTYNMHDAKSNFSRLVDQAAAGQEIIIAKAGKPVARLVALRDSSSTRRLGVADGQWDIPDDFDDPLPSAIFSVFSEDE